ncbi:MAG: TolC family protein [Leptospira sp.]|nr:TolC family protein [Leptospira sp.]
MNYSKNKWIVYMISTILLFLPNFYLFSQDNDEIEGKEATQGTENLIDAAKSNTVSFKDLSLSIQKHSFQIQALEKEAASAKTGKERTARHWHPRVYLEGRAFATNDPAVNFFSILGQREARQMDFSTASNRNQIGNFLDTNNQPYTNLNSQNMNLFAPDNLNYPGTNVYQRGTVGVDLPLYEGGAKSSVAQSYEHVSRGKSLEKKAVILSEYSSTAGLYAQLIFLDEYKKKIANLKSQVQGILNRYQVGARTNPVGYSGLLGLKSVKNRLEGLETEANTREESIRDYLVTMAEDLEKDWVTELEPVPNFLNKHLPAPNENQSGTLQATTISYQAQAMQEYAESAGRAAEAEKAKFLPRAGVFGESNLYSGSRNTATAYNVGFYVQMSLYNGEDIGSYEEARLKGEAAKEKALDQIRKESAKKKELLAMERALTKQLTLLENSTKLMEEQVTNSRRLFTNGSINAIQMSEILSRSADLLIEKANANREYILVRSQLYTLFSN